MSICDICKCNTYCETKIDPHTHEEYYICNNCSELVEQGESEFEINQTLKEMTCKQYERMYQ